MPHHGIEKLVERSGLPFAYLRPNDFMQNFATVHREDIRERGAIWAPAGRGKASFVDVRDVGEAAAAIFVAPEAHGGRGHTLTGPEALGMAQVAQALSEATGRRVRYADPSIPGFLSHSRRIGRPLPLALVMSMLYSMQRFGRAAEVTPDLGRLTGRPATPFSRFARDFADLWR